ncbi:MAG: ABC transporter permease [Vicinamibacterales bacterium]|nr:ABC transporter permease [Vicinamibacterales bacterium]
MPGAARGAVMQDLLQDIRYAVRSFLRAPRFTIPAVLALALGVGATSAIFSVVRGVMLEPLPYASPDRIVSIWEANVSLNQTRNVVSAANFLAWKERNRSFEYLGLTGPSRLIFILDGQPHEVSGLIASSEVFAALGVQPAMGRTYTAEEDLEGNAGVIMISHEFWRSGLGGRPDILGTTVVANGRPFEVIGVMPPRFTIEGQRADFYRTYAWTLEALRSATGRGTSHAIARLRDGVTLAQAQDEMRTIAAVLEKEEPRRNTGWSVAVVPIHEITTETIRPALLILAGAVLLVLLIACVNVANLLLARSTVRQRELGLRTALGAGRSRLLRQMLTESLLLSVIGGVAGIALAAAFHRGLLALVADRIPVPRLDQVTLDFTVVGFTMALSLGTGLLFGLVPALMATAMANDALREGGRHGSGPRSRRALGTLVVAEVALSLVLLAGAGLLIRSFVKLQSIDPGFRAEGVFTARVNAPSARYPTGGDAERFFSRALEAIRQIPAVQSAAGISFLPLAGPGMGTSFYRTDLPIPADGERPGTEVRPVTPNYFRTMGIPHLAGRDFTEADSADAPLVAVVSEGLVRRMYPGESPLGKRLQVAIGRAEGMDVEIVGVVGDVRFASLDAETRPAVYIPLPQLSIGLVTFVVRTGMEPLTLTSSVSAAVRSLDPEVPLADVRTMEAVVDATLARPRVVAVLLSAFAALALLLAGVGIYGVMAYSVAQRTQELGVRMALGATPASVFRLVLGQSLRLVLAGVALGLVAAAGLTRLLEALLYDTAPLDPWTFGATALLLVLVSMLASYVPARRGTRIAPVEALRAD